MGARGWGRAGGVSIYCGQRLRLGRRERSGEDGGDGCTQCERAECRCGVHLKMVKMVNPMLRVFHFNKKMKKRVCL